MQVKYFVCVNRVSIKNTFNISQKCNKSISLLQQNTLQKQSSGYRVTSPASDRNQRKIGRGHSKDPQQQRVLTTDGHKKDSDNDSNCISSVSKGYVKSIIKCEDRDVDIKLLHFSIKHCVKSQVTKLTLLSLW